MVDGQADLNYFGLARVRAGPQAITLCQLDLVNRTEPDPAADTILVNLIAAGVSHRPTPQTRCFALGQQAAAWTRLAAVRAEPLTDLEQLDGLHMGHRYP